MRDPITDAAQDPSCLLCLTPDRGGSWWSRLRPAQLRNFAADPMTFTDSYTAQDGIGTDDFTLSVDFTLLRENAGGDINIGCVRCMYYSYTKGYQLFVRILKSDGTKDALYPVGTSHISENVASIKVIKTGQNVRMVVYARDGSAVKDQTKPLPDGATVTSLSEATNYPGNIFAASIRNDTTGTAVWQAAYSDLYDTSNPWPSPVPENFAENAKAFYDCQAVVQEALDPTHDYSFLIEADRVSERTENSLFYAGTDKLPFGVYYHADHTIKFFTNLLRNEGDPSGTYASLNFYTGTDWLPGRHAFEARIEGNAITTYVDGVQYATSNKFARTGTAAVGLPNCNSGYVYKIQITDLTDNQVVWSYPSEAERVRLITKTNVRTDRGAFEAADENISAGVVTQLDLRGNTTSKTFWARGYFPKHANTGVLYIYPLIGQGDIVLGPDAWVFRVTAWEDNRTTSGAINLRCDFCDADNVARLCQLPITDDFFNATHDIAYVIDFQANGAFCSVYIDGLVAVQKNFTASAFGAGATSAMSANVGIRQDPIQNYLSGNSVECALVFDRALSAAEIAALTPKKQPLSWAGIRDVVRRGRAQRYFAVGDVLTVATPRWTIEYEVTGFDQVEPADAALTHSMTLLPVRLVTNLQFDAPEPGNPDANRAQFGCNRWDWSAIRQWLNSAAAPGEWWTAQHEYDAAPAYAATLAGFMADLPADFLSAVAPARLVTALPNADGGGSVETVDRFWLPSRTEIFGDANNGVAEGVLMAKYVDATDADRIKYEASGSARSWWLRSPSDDTARLSATSVSGTRGTAFTTNTYGVAAACIIA